MAPSKEAVLATTVYDEVISVNRIVNKTPANLFLMDRPDLISTFTKIELWKQTQFRQIVYIDADAVALRAPNELLNLETEFAASPDVGWPDCFNSGVMKTLHLSGQPLGDMRRVQSYVKGEADPAIYGFTTPSPPPSQPNSIPERLLDVAADLGSEDRSSVQEPRINTGQPQGDLAASAAFAEPEQFLAPHNDWDAAHAPPPLNSRPEASNFPTTRYLMSQDTQLFQPPASYPEAPKDMWYRVPPTPPVIQKPAPIFPWETKSPKPTRVFLDEKPPSPALTVESTPSPSATTDETKTSTENSPSTPTIKVTGADPWQSFSRSNAWDELPAIDRYLQAFSQARKEKVQVIHQSSDHDPPEGVSSPSIEEPIRRPSMKLTDFPTEIERPSLPVTPAPVRRPTFWGEEREEGEGLPPAEGVPRQEDWVSNLNPKNFNPIQKLEELQRRQSEILGKGGAQSPSNDIPEREMPKSGSVAAAASAASQSVSTASPPALKDLLQTYAASNNELQHDEESARISAAT
ncbi:MAG: hypothetical protein Q9227_009405 [Pyrenula ochraceoflavens]